LPRPWGRPWYFYNLQDFKPTIMIESHGTRHRVLSLCSVLPLKR
jgi:hypothetical protein